MGGRKKTGLESARKIKLERSDDYVPYHFAWYCGLKPGMDASVHRCFYSNRPGWASSSSRSRKLLKRMTTSRYRCWGSRSTRSRSFSAMSIICSQDDGDGSDVWLRVRILKSLVFSL